MGEAAGGVLAFFIATGVVPALALAAGASILVTTVLDRAGVGSGRRALLGLAVASVAGILAVTLLREITLVTAAVRDGAVLRPPGLSALGGWSTDEWRRVSADPWASTQFVLNVLLFAPAGLLWAVLTRRPVAVLLGLLGLAVAIESTQAVTGLGAHDLTDIAANGLGAVMGVALAVAAGWVGDELAGRREGARQWVLRVATVSVTVVALSAATVLGAQRRQDAVAAQAEQAFGGTVLEDVDRWADDDELEPRMWRGVLAVDADAFVHHADEARVRYPTGFLGRRTCVLVTWTRAEVLVERTSGSFCEVPDLAVFTPGQG